MYHAGAPYRDDSSDQKEKHSTQAKNRAKGNLQKGMFLSQEDVEAVSANATAPLHGAETTGPGANWPVKRQVPWAPS